MEKLREKIARIICCFAEKNKGCAECKYNIPETPFPDCFCDIRDETDQILSLFRQHISEDKVKAVKEILVRASLVDGFSQYITPQTIENTATQICQLFKVKLPENTCLECGEYRPGDERVQNGMKCMQCAY